ncbi:MAG: DUF3237 domain-containing protein [Pseudomonadales bacterium]|jgi:hypothetical protein|nr:DUF3237 domain-containing protein [Pseudomonadales bacterium]
MMYELHSRFLCELTATLDNVPVGPTPEGTRILAYVTGGSVTGERLSGRLLPGGGDFALIMADGCLHIDVRACLETDDGARIYTTYGGRLYVPPEAAAVMTDPAARTRIDPTAYYFRTAPLFQTAAESWSWLNRVLCVGVGRLTPEGVAYRIHEIL